ncbi:Lipopolysaccharide N-acetylglucosaminyltransferase [Roseomonas mucosa]|uniref:glycosyltransferase family 4 protein n=1 Tax=Roseomonas TaxID=125216 RepID=UPI000C184AC3|nr:MULTISPECIES: glycosyltransferase [Roseomonas]ATR21931.1 hypothetical protein CTJ15_17595 [Roseomonas sp. FDAARGOS_362]UZO95592.1 Lipopolysaccharide N-acetylglucosaminyltransferase [Roseomonas mucosa]
MSGDRTSGAALLAEADARRDAGDWLAAAEAYAGVIRQRPDAWPLMLQRGLCLLAAHLPEEALDSFREAESLSPRDPEIQRQIAATLRRLGRPVAPQPAVEDGFPAAGPEEAWHGPSGAPFSAPRPENQDAAAGMDVAFDVTDLLDYFRGKRTPTGIQRVQCGIVGATLRGGNPPGTRIAYVSYDLREACWRAVPAAALRGVIEASHTGAETDDPAWIMALERVDEALAQAPRHLFPLGGLLVNLGNSWGLPDYFRGLRAAQRDRRIRYIPFLHDCVPLVVPEHCQEQMVRDYARWFAAVGVHAHGFLCNSECTRRDGRTQLDRLLPELDLPMEVVRLDADPMSDGTEPDPLALEGLRGFRPGQPYALFVGTIESRKDHLLVFRAWLSLIRRLGAGRVPRLVCVGQPGWHAQGALELLANSAELKRHVVLLHGVSDAALAALYAGCRFTVYNSFYEGWGLPVTESLAHGKVPVIPEHSALPEAGGPAAVYFAPQHEPDLAAKLERLIADPSFLAEREAAVRQHAGLRRWEALRDEVLCHLQAMAARTTPALEERLALQPGQPYRMVLGDEMRPDAAMAVRQVLRDGPNWHMPEVWGVWTKGGAATLRLPVPPGPAAPWRLYMELVAPPGGGEVRLRAEAEGNELAAGSLYLEAGAQGGCALRLEVPEGCRLLRADIESTPVHPEGDERVLGAALVRVMLCREDDLAGRLGWIEGQRLRELAA